MNVGRLLVFGFGLAATPAAQAAPILPMEEGTTWSYTQLGAESPSVTIRIAGRETRAGKDLLKIETLAGDEVTRRELIAIDERGVLCHERIIGKGGVAMFDPPQVIVPGELKTGTTWELEDGVAGAVMRQQWSALAEEEVVVPAGKLRAFHLRCAQPWPISITIERWFAPGVGVIKDVTTTRGPSGRLLSRVALVLQELPRVVKISKPPLAPAPATAEESVLSEEPTVSSTRGPTKITLQVGSARDGEPQTEFRSDVSNIFVWWMGENMPADSAVRIAWIAEDVGDVAPANFVVDQTETEVTSPEFSARFTLSRPKDGWAAGKYRVELYLNDELRETVRVNIAD